SPNRLPWCGTECEGGRTRDRVSARGEGEMVGLDQHAVRDNAIEHLPGCRDRLRPIHVEGRLPIGMAGKEIGVTYRVAHRQHRMIAGMNGESRMTRRMPKGGD